MTLRRVGVILAGLPHGSAVHRAVEAAERAAAALNPPPATEGPGAEFLRHLTERQAHYGALQGIAP